MENLISALIGVIVGGILTFGAELYFKRREESAKIRCGVISLQAEIARICEHFSQFLHYIDEARISSESPIVWTKLRPYHLFSYENQKIEILPEIVDKLIKVDRMEYVQLVYAAEHKLNTHLSIQAQYNALISEVDRRILPYSEIKPNSVEFDFSFDGRKDPELLALINKTNDSARKLCDLCEPLRSDMQNLQQGFPDFAELVCGRSFRITITETGNLSQ